MTPREVALALVKRQPVPEFPDETVVLLRKAFNPNPQPRQQRKAA